MIDSFPKETRLYDMIPDQETLMLIMNSALDATICIDANGAIMLWSNPAETIFGWTSGEVLGKQLSETIIPEKYRERHNAGMNRYVTTGKSTMLNRLVEISAQNKEGREFPVELTILPITQKDKTCFCAVIRDISERKIVEEQLQQSELRYNSLIDQASDAIMITDHLGNFSDVNDSLCKMFGYTREELLGRNVSMVIDPEQLKDDPIKFGVILSGQPVLRERRMMHKNGTIIEVEANVRMIPDGRVLAIARDITERKKAEAIIRLSEQKYKLLFNINPMPMMMLSSPDMNFTDVNEAAILQYGYSREEFLSMNAKNIRPEEDVDLFFETMGKSTDGINNFGVWQHKRKNGSIFQVEIYAHKIIYNDRPVWLALANDVTAKIQSEEKLKQSHRELRELSSHLQTIREEERTSIAREIHDELGQQLTGLKMDASWLNKKISKDELAIHQKINGMISLIDDTVKTVRRISSELRPGILDDLGLVDALEWQSHEFEKRTGIRSRFNSTFSEAGFDKNLSTGIFRVFQETLTNVARHAQATEIKTTLERDDGHIVLRVRDNGTGFNETEIQHKNTLGLMGMKERALMFGGNLTIESSKGKGTLITLQVPLKIVSGTSQNT